ncbi:MAG: hypothetical protein ACFFDY_14955 [Candidatus Thorarchaeota archaeon]
MSNKKTNPYPTTNPKKDKDKIVYGNNKSVCFACGEKIKSNTKICPYCNTPIN